MPAAPSPLSAEEERWWRGVLGVHPLRTYEGLPAGRPDGVRDRVRVRRWALAQRPETSCRQLSRGEPRSPTTPRVEGSGRTVLACPTPAASTPPTKPAREPSPLGSLIQSGPTSLAPPLAPGRLLACHGIHRSPVPRAGQTARPGTGRGRTMTEASVSFAGNLTDNPELRHTDGGIARAMAGWPCRVGGTRSRRSSLWSCGVTRPSMPASR